MQTPSDIILDSQILSLELRVRNFEYARKWFQELRANADELEILQYDEALAKNRAAIASLKRDLRSARSKSRRAQVCRGDRNVAIHEPCYRDAA